MVNGQTKYFFTVISVSGDGFADHVKDETDLFVFLIRHSSSTFSHHYQDGSADHVKDETTM